MVLKLNRIGPILSDRIVLTEGCNDVDGLHADHTFTGWLLRLVSWVCSPRRYSDENRRTIACVKNYMDDLIGPQRLDRVCKRYGMDLEQMKAAGAPLLSRDIAMIMTGIKDVKIDDLVELIELSKKETEVWPKNIDFQLRYPLSLATTPNQLDSVTFAKVYDALSAIEGFANVPTIDEEIQGSCPTEILATFFHDPLLADRERLVLCKENPTDSFRTFVHNFVARIIGREMEVAMLIPAPNKVMEDKNKPPIRQFYTVSAKIISGEGIVEYVLMPATSDSDLKPIENYRGTSLRPSAVDASSSVLTDGEEKLGFTAAASGEIYETELRKVFGEIPIGAGHSLGATLLQYAMLNHTDIREAYFFNTPALPPGYASKYYEKLRQIGVHGLPKDKDGKPIKYKFSIADTKTDIYSTVGTEVLGLKAPRDLVDVEYLKYHPLNNTSTGYAHVQVPDRENRFIGIEGFIREEVVDEDGVLKDDEIDAELHRESHPERWFPCVSNESFRRTFGPYVVAVIRFARDFFRRIFGSRTYQLRGMQYGTYNEEGKFSITYFRPGPYQPTSNQALNSSFAT